MNDCIIMNGNMIANSIKDNLRERVKALKEHGVSVGLGTLLIGNDPASISYVNSKHEDCREIGIDSIRSELPTNVTMNEAIAGVNAMNKDENVTGFIMQLPLPAQLNTDALIDEINPEKDADGLTPYNLGSLTGNVNGDYNTPVPCTAAGVIRLLEAYDVRITGRNICIIGRGLTAGRPLSLMLSNRNYNATVDICHSQTWNLPYHVNNADIIISCVGKPGFIDKGWFTGNKRPILINVGISRVQDETGKYHIKGDFNPNCKEIASMYAPAAGGVGPMTRVMLLENVIRMAERKLELINEVKTDNERSHDDIENVFNNITVSTWSALDNLVK